MDREMDEVREDKMSQWERQLQRRQKEKKLSDFLMQRERKSSSPVWNTWTNRTKSRS